MTNEEIKFYDINEILKEKDKLAKENKQLKEEKKKAIEYIENMDAVLWNECHKYNFSCDDLLEMLGDKE